MWEMNELSDVKGVKVGHAELEGVLTGCTVVLVEEGATCGVFVSGGAPGARETNLLEPENLVEKVHAIYIGGGSAFGLEGATGVMQFLEERNIGFDTGVKKVPIVPGAIIFDLALSNGKYPTKEIGYKACLKAVYSGIGRGNVGAGIGATIGKARGMDFAMKGGIGTSSVRSRNLVVSALVVVNAFGDVIDTKTNRIIAGALDNRKNGFVNTEELIIQGNTSEAPFNNTTIGVVATNGKLSKAMAKRVSIMAQDGIARAVRPSHTLFDGDTVFTLSTNEIKEDVSKIGVMAARAVELAIIDAVKSAKSVGTILSSNDIIF